MKTTHNTISRAYSLALLGMALSGSATYARPIENPRDNIDTTQHNNLTRRRSK
jgi:hypothetical protein